MWKIVLGTAGLGILLTGCATNPQFASLEGTCSAFPRPEYQIKGKTKYDQTWADKITEAGVAGCRWDRPLRRPPELDRSPATQAVIVSKGERPTVFSPTPETVVTVAPKKGIWQTIRHPIKAYKERKARVKSGS